MKYDNKHGVTFKKLSDPTAPSPLQFNTLHSFRDLELYPTAKPVITAPAPKTNTLDIPGADGELDFTEALTGDVNYSNRKGTFPYVYIGDRKNWDDKYHDILNLLHGYRMGFELDDDPGGYYAGRLTVQEPQFVNGRYYVTMEANLDTYWRYNQTSIDPWIWDTFRFSTDMIRQPLRDIIIAGDNTVDNPVMVTLVGSRMPVNPNVFLSDWQEGDPPIMCRFPVGRFPYVEYLDRALHAGDNRNPDFILRYETKFMWLYHLGEATETAEAGKVSVKYDLGIL